MTLDDLTEILGKADVTIDGKGDHYEIRPKHYLGDAFGELHKKLKTVGAKWDSDKTDKTKSHWTLPKEKN